jgi:drug/metabolite transporter (DMT)-like permease
MSQNQRPLLGFFLALIASMTWGSLPLAAQQVLKAMDAPTLVWSRFVVAAIVVFGLLWYRKGLPQLNQISRKTWLIIAMAVVGLTFNFTLYSQALLYISPTTNQVLWQFAPFGMILIGVMLFGEKMGVYQKIGSGLLMIGLIAFFNNHFGELFQMGHYAIGILLGSAAALIWVMYGVAQKLLLEKFTSSQILLLIYFGCALLLSPIASPSQLGNLHGALWGFFGFCCANTLIGYGAFGESLNRWDASKVSVITTMAPIFTMIFSLLAHAVNPERFAAVDMNTVSYIGVLVVVAGAVLAVAGDKLLKKNSTLETFD